VNFGNEIHDRKGLLGSVKLTSPLADSVELKGNWHIYCLQLDATMLDKLKWQPSTAIGPAFWRGSFKVAKGADTFLDLSNWGKGVIWVNGHCLARFWNIGPTQSAYLPGAWLKPGANEVVILDLLGPSDPTLRGLENTVLDMLRPELDFALRQTANASLLLDDAKPVLSGTFAAGPEAQDIKFPAPVRGKQFCIESLNAHDGKPYAAIAELDLIDDAGNSLPHQNWSIAYVDSEELLGEDGSASNAIDGQTANFWHTAWKDSQPNHPHRIVIDLGKTASIAGFRYTPRAGSGNPGVRIKDFQISISERLSEPAQIETNAK
jgi:beta-galactosidase